MPWVIILSTAAALLGFYLGVQSKAVAKRKALDKEKKMVEKLHTTEYKKCPPPPPPSRVIREGKKPVPPKNPENEFSHMEPSFYYKKKTFVKTNKCKNCKVIGYNVDIASYKPCPKCGGKVKTHGVCKWDKKSKTWIETTAK